MKQIYYAVRFNGRDLYSIRYTDNVKQIYYAVRFNGHDLYSIRYTDNVKQIYYTVRFNGHDLYSIRYTDNILYSPIQWTCNFTDGSRQFKPSTSSLVH